MHMLLDQELAPYTSAGPSRHGGRAPDPCACMCVCVTVCVCVCVCVPADPAGHVGCAPDHLSACLCVCLQALLDMVDTHLTALTAGPSTRKVAAGRGAAAAAAAAAAEEQPPLQVHGRVRGGDYA